MSKKTGVVALLGMVALSLLLVSCGSSSSRPSGLLYVLSQAASNVSSYAIDLSNGNLSLTTSNLVATCPTPPCGLPLSISLDPTGATAFVLNQTTISSYTVHSDGSLSTGTSTSLPAGQTALAMTRDAAGAFLFVITTPPSPALGNQPTISVFGTKPGSTTVTPASTALLTRVPTALSVLTFTPPGGSAQTLLFVTSNLDLTPNHNDNELSVYAVDGTGNLTEQLNSPYTTEVNPGGVLAVNTNPPAQNTGGVFVYVGSQGAITGAVSTFELCTQVNQVCSQQMVTAEQLGSVGSPASVGQNPGSMLTDPTNSFLYIACTRSNAVYAFHMTTGTGVLTALSPASQPTGGSPMALAMHPNFNAGAQFLYVSNNTGSSITGFNAAVTTGSLSSPITVIFSPGAPSGIAGR